MLLLELVRQAAQALPRDYDIEIVEAHHRDKTDAPSGTALALGEAAAEGAGRESGGAGGVRAPRRTPVARRDGQIGFAVRAGRRCGRRARGAGSWAQGERLLLKHSATDRAVFARGALLAAQWLAGQAAGTLRDAGCFYQ